MTAQEIRAQAPPMAVQMADEAIRAARRAITCNTELDDVYAICDLPEVDTAGRVLFRMFSGSAIDIEMALIEMPKEMNGFVPFRDESYTDEFVATLDRILKEDLATYERYDRI